ncbi:MAG: hypothetical protein ABSE73_21900 [Planctomycetota bacterium]
MPPQRDGLSVLPAACTDEAALNSQRGHIRGTSPVMHFQSGGKPPHSKEMWYNARMASFWSNRNLPGTRDAVLVHGLTMLAGCISIVLVIILRPNDEAFCAALGVAFSATGVLLVWSLTLAVRAWRRGEHNGWCWAVMVLGGPETLLLSVIAYPIRFVFLHAAPLQWAYETGIIVFLPVGAIAHVVAVAVTWWRLRRAAKRDAGAGLQPRSHWKRGLVWFCAAAKKWLDEHKQDCSGEKNSKILERLSHSALCG